MMNDLAVITCFFSYTKNPYAVKRYREFQKKLNRQGVKLYTVELAFFDEDYLLDDDVYLRLRTDTVLWHKESLLNILAKRLPPYIKKIAWLDCDIEIKDDEWGPKASELLDEYKVIEIGSRHIYLDKDEKEERSPMTTGYGYHHNKPDWKDFSKYHPGLGWASRRELFHDHGGLFRYCISGGGDGLMAYLFGTKSSSEKWVPDWKYKDYRGGCPTIIDRIENYKNKVCAYVDGEMSYLDGDVIHRYHAPSSRRGYISRPQILNGIDFNKDILEGQNGLLEWKDVRYNKVFETFFNMKDDQSKKDITYHNINVAALL